MMVEYACWNWLVMLSDEEEQLLREVLSGPASRWRTNRVWGESEGGVGGESWGAKRDLNQRLRRQRAVGSFHKGMLSRLCRSAGASVDSPHRWTRDGEMRGESGRRPRQQVLEGSSPRTCAGEDGGTNLLNWAYSVTDRYVMMANGSSEL